jgi:hypothetical protein
LRKKKNLIRFGYAREQMVPTDISLFTSDGVGGGGSAPYGANYLTRPRICFFCVGLIIIEK